MTNNVILQFLQEIVVRFRKKSPLFFQILQYISIVVALIPGIPAFLEYVGVDLGPVLLALANKTIAIAGIVAAFLMGLPVDKDIDTKPKVAIEVEPTEVITQKEIDLPFTDKHK